MAITVGQPPAVAIGGVFIHVGGSGVVVEVAGNIHPMLYHLFGPSIVIHPVES